LLPPRKTYEEHAKKAERKNVGPLRSAIPIYQRRCRWGEITHLTCEGGGEIELVQTGETFAGTATQAGSCMTEGGQGPFWPPSFPPVLEVSNGVISGKYISWDFNNCGFTAKVVGSGDKLMGEGTCDIPLPAPYFLTNPTWKAQRD
jgi:hypothetical protein